MGLARKSGKSVCFAFYQERFFAAAEKTRFQCRERSAHRPVDLQNAGDLMELVHEGGQLRAILDLDLDADDGEAVLRAAGVQTQHKGFGGERAEEMSSSRFSRSLQTASMVVG